MGTEPDTDDRTEAASASRLEAARLRGDFADTSALMVSLGLLGATLLLVHAGPRAGETLLRAMTLGLPGAWAARAPLLERAQDGGAQLLAALAEALVPLFALAALLALAQVGSRGGPVALWSRLAPDFSRFDPSDYWTAASWRRRAQRCLFALARLAAVAGVVYARREGADGLASAWASGDLRAALSAGWGLLGSLLLDTAFALVAIGLVECLLQLRLHRRRLGMSRREVVEEAREVDGDPGLRKRRLRLWKSWSAARGGGAK